MKSHTKNKGFPIEYNLINNILKDWNPIDIEGPAVEEEYIKIIPTIIRNISNKEKLIEILEEYLVDDLGVNYDSQNSDHKRDLITIIEKIMDLNKKK